MLAILIYVDYACRGTKDDDALANLAQPILVHPKWAGLPWSWSRPVHPKMVWCTPSGQPEGKSVATGPLKGF